MKKLNRNQLAFCFEFTKEKQENIQAVPTTRFPAFSIKEFERLPVINFRNFTFPFPSKLCVHVEYHSGTFQHIQNGALRQKFATVFR